MSDSRVRCYEGSISSFWRMVRVYSSVRLFSLYAFKSLLSWVRAEIVVLLLYCRRLGLQEIFRLGAGRAQRNTFD